MKLLALMVAAHFCVARPAQYYYFLIYEVKRMSFVRTNNFLLGKLIGMEWKGAANMVEY